MSNISEETTEIISEAEELPQNDNKKRDKKKKDKQKKQKQKKIEKLGLVKFLLKKDELNCCICHDIFVDPVSIPCGHNYCSGCINKYIRSFQSSDHLPCPLCKERHLKSNLTNIKPNMLLNKILKRCKIPEYKDRLEEHVLEKAFNESSERFKGSMIYGNISDEIIRLTNQNKCISIDSLIAQISANIPGDHILGIKYILATRSLHYDILIHRDMLISGDDDDLESFINENINDMTSQEVALLMKGCSDLDIKVKNPSPLYNELINLTETRKKDLIEYFKKDGRNYLVIDDETTESSEELPVNFRWCDLPIQGPE